MKFNTHWIDAILMNEAGAGGASAAGAGAAAGGAAAGGAAAEAGAAAAGAAAGAGARSAAGAESGAAAAGQSSSSSPGAAAAGAPYRPAGLPDHYMGANDQETMDKMSNALAGYRNQTSDVPADAAGYKEFAKIDDAIKPHMDTIIADPLFDRMTSYAKEKGLGKGVFQDLVSTYIGVAAEMGILEPPLDVAKEQEQLTPENARHLPAPEQAKARDARMADNLAFLDLQLSKDGGKDGGLSKETIDFTKMMMGDRAAGHQLIEFMRAKVSGGGKGPLLNPDGGGGGADPKADIERRRTLPENTWGNPAFDRGSYDKLQADARKVHGDQ